MRDRNAFMVWCSDNRYEFSSLRRAIFTTMHMLYAMLTLDDVSEKPNVQQCIELLQHACTCNDPLCGYVSCGKMKFVLCHIKACSERSIGTCTKCNKLIALICKHAKGCSVARCPVPFCLVVRLKRSEQMLSLELREREVKRRVTATIHRTLTR